MIAHHTNGKLPLLHCGQHHQVHHHAEDVDGEDDEVEDNDNVEPEDSEGHVNNDDKAPTLHQTEGVNQAVLVQGGGMGQGEVGREVGEGERSGGVGGGIEEEGGGSG